MAAAAAGAPKDRHRSFLALISVLYISVKGEPIASLTPNEIEYASSLGAIRSTADTTTLAGLGTVSDKWRGSAFAPTTGMLYCAPSHAASVLMINPSTNVTDTTTLAGLGTGSYKWSDIAFAPTTGMLYCAPDHAASVLMINPLTNITDITTLAGIGPGANGRWMGIAFVPTTGKLYCAPENAASVLMINPSTNTTDTTTLAGLGAGGYKWRGIAFAPTTGMLYCAPRNAASVLMINPSTNTTDTTTLAGLGAGVKKWYGITFAPTTGMLYCAPRNAASVLMVTFSVALHVLQPFRLIASQNTTIASQSTAIATLESTVASQNVTIASQSTAIGTLESTVASQNVTIASQNATITALESQATSPQCGNGTISSNGACIPDCNSLRRRSISCEPFCEPLQTAIPTAVPTLSPTILVTVVAIVVLLIGIFIYKRNINKARAKHPPLPSPPVVNPAFAPDEPLDQNYAVVDETQMSSALDRRESVYEQPVTSNPDYDLRTSKAFHVYDVPSSKSNAVKLDGDAYVAEGVFHDDFSHTKPLRQSQTCDVLYDDDDLDL